MRSQKGFTIIEIAVVVLIVGLLGFIGVRMWGSYTSHELANTEIETTQVQDVTDTASLNQVEKQLDNIDVVGSFEQDLDAENF